MTYSHDFTACVTAADPAGAAIQVRAVIEVCRPAGTALVKTTSAFTPGTVAIQAGIEQDGATVCRREWRRERHHDGVAP